MKTCKDLLSQKVKFSLHKVFFLENLDDKPKYTNDIHMASLIGI